MSRTQSFDSPDVEKEFPGLYMSDRRPEDVASAKYEAEEVGEKYKSRKDFLKKEKKDKKKDKEKGYVAFEEEDSGDEKTKGEDIRSPARLKKHSKPSFKFAKKDKFPAIKKDKDDRREGKKGDFKEKKLRVKKKSKPTDTTDEVKPIFGVSLQLAVTRNRCYDGVELPALVRECIDYIEEHGLSCEGIYRISGVKSKVQALKDAYNKGREVKIFEHEPNVVASLLKQFLRELPEPVLTVGLMPQFEEASTIKDQTKKASEFKRLIYQLPKPNRLLLSWMIQHMAHVIARADQNKMSLQNVSIVLSPTMQISHRVLNVLFHNTSLLFSDLPMKKYVPPLKPATSKWSLELPDQPIAIEEELAKQEALLNQLHAEINAGMTDSEKEEQLWEVQRIVTQLKRKLKTSKKSQSHKPSLNTIDDEIVLNLALAEPQVNDKPESKTVEKSSDLPANNATEQDVVTVVDKEMEVVDKVAEKDVAEIETDLEKTKLQSEQVVEEESGEDVTSNVTSVTVGTETDDVTEKNEEVVEKKEADCEESNEEEVLESTTPVPDPQPARRPEFIETDSFDSSVRELADIITPTEQNPPDTAPPEMTSSRNVVFRPIRDDESSFDDTETPNQEEMISGAVRPVAMPHNLTVEFQEDWYHASGDSTPPLVPPRCWSPSLQSPLKPEILHKMEQQRALDQTDLDDTRIGGGLDPGVDHSAPESQDEEYKSLVYQLQVALLEEEELLAMGVELRKKIEVERDEMESLQQEIAEVRSMRDCDSDDDDLVPSSDSDRESGDEDELQTIVQTLIKDNLRLERENHELVKKIDVERQICLDVKIQIRMIQQQAERYGTGTESLL